MTAISTTVVGAPPSQSALPERVLSILRCLDCRKALVQGDNGLLCSSCARLYPLINGTYKFVGFEHYAGSFGFQWRKHATTQMDDEACRRSEKNFRRKTDLSPQMLAGKLVLDVGCGMGRYADVATRWGAYVIGIDLSQAAEVAAANLAGRNASFLQADVFSLPFAAESFDYIYSIGVLHHTPNCEQAFKQLPRLLKPGGQIAIWLYSGYNPWFRFSDLYRKITTRLSPRVLHAICRLADPMYHVHSGLRKIPLVGRVGSGILGHLFPMSMDPDARWRVLDTFDWYSPAFQSKHTYEQVFRWFEDCGLQTRVLYDTISVQGTKPRSGSERGSCAE